jgi:hypothetical protein
MFSIQSSSDPAQVTPQAEDTCGRRALCGWSPPASAADTALKRAVDRWLPSTGIAVVIFFAAVAGLLLCAPLFPRRGELAIDGLAALAAGGWCALNFWRCRHAHCLVTSVGWLGLATLASVEVAVGRSMIHGDEQLVFIAVLGLGLVFELAWFKSRGTNVVAIGENARC